MRFGDDSARVAGAFGSAPELGALEACLDVQPRSDGARTWTEAAGALID